MTENKEKLKENYKEQFKEALTDLKTPGKRKKQIPNLLTASRLLSPVIIIPAALVGNVAFAAGAAALFGLTDFFDGKLARKWDAKSQFGADLDAVTDKLFAGTLLLAGAIFNPLLLANVALEGLIAGINVKEKLDGKKPASTKTGKVKTGFLFGLGALGLIAPALSLPTALLPGLALTTAALQGVTALSYLKKYDHNSDEESVPTPSYYSSDAFHEAEQKAIEESLSKTYQTQKADSAPMKRTDSELDRIIDQMLLEEEQATLTSDRPKEFTKTRNQ